MPDLGSSTGPSENPYSPELERRNVFFQPPKTISLRSETAPIYRDLSILHFLETIFTGLFPDGRALSWPLVLALSPGSLPMLDRGRKEEQDSYLSRAHFVPGPLLYMLSYLNHTEPGQMDKLRLRELQKLGHGPTASKEQSWDSMPNLFPPDILA